MISFASKILKLLFLMFWKYCNLKYMPFTKKVLKNCIEVFFLLCRIPQDTPYCDSFYHNRLPLPARHCVYGHTIYKSKNGKRVHQPSPSMLRPLLTWCAPRSSPVSGFWLWTSEVEWQISVRTSVTLDVPVKQRLLYFPYWNCFLQVNQWQVS